MKFERINDRQIRCTLTRDDLAKRGLRLSEFAYGTDKARELFREIMEQADEQLGFDAAEYPLMIEAVPMGIDCLVLMITQVEDPEELDTRFSAFGPVMDDDDEESDEYDYDDEDDNAFMKMLKGLQDSDYSSIRDRFEARLVPGSVRQMTGRAIAAKQAGEKKPHPSRIFSFASMHDVSHAAAMAADISPKVKSTLYRDNDERIFYLCLTYTRQDKPDSSFVGLCTMLAEYGSAAGAGTISEEYLEEHCETLIKDNALEKLASI